MSKHLAKEVIARNAAIHAAPEGTQQPNTVDRTMELPTVLYGTTVALYLGFLAIMASVTMTPGLMIPMVIFALSIVAGFGIPTIWATMQPDNPSSPMSWSRFRQSGIATLSGRLTAGEATAQVLVLPVLIFAWGITVAMIIAAN